MAEGSSEAFAAAFRWLGVKAQPTPALRRAHPRTGRQVHQRRRMLSRPRSRWAIFSASSSSPALTPSARLSSCPPPKVPAASASTRLSCARSCARRATGDVQVLSPTSQNGYEDLGEIATPFMRTAWRALVCARHAAPRAAEDPALRNHSGRRRPGLSGVARRRVRDDREQLRRRRLPAPLAGGVHDARPRPLPARSGALRPGSPADRRGGRNLLPAEYFSQRRPDPQAGGLRRRVLAEPHRRMGGLHQRRGQNANCG